MGIRPYIRNFSNGGIIEEMASGATCLTLDYSGDIIQAAARAKEAKKDFEPHYIAPKEGAQLTFDMLAIPKDAPHAADAMTLINFLEQPDVMAAITNKVRYPNAIPASKAMIQPDIANDPGIYPPPEEYKDFFTVTAVSAEATRARGRMWARFKAGH
jgi:putrescine transport system substrate-binding protein